MKRSFSGDDGGVIEVFALPLTNVEDRLHLGKLQINLHFRSVCTTFAGTKLRIGKEKEKKHDREETSFCTFR